MDTSTVEVTMNEDQKILVENFENAEDIPRDDDASYSQSNVAIDGDEEQMTTMNNAKTTDTSQIATVAISTATTTTTTTKNATNVANHHSAQQLYQLSPELIYRAEQEVNEKDSWRERDIQALRDMILEQTILKSRLDNQFLLQFLRARRFDYDNAFCLLCDYYRLLAASPELFPSIDGHLGALFTGIGCENECSTPVLSRTPGRSNQDEAVILMRLGSWDVLQFTFDDILAACILVLESTVDGDDITQINGIVLTIDLAGFSWAHLRKFGPAMARKFIHTLENCLPIRLKAVYVTNESTFASLLFALMKPFMSEEFHGKIHFLGSNWRAALHRSIRPEILPRQFGGTLLHLNSDTLLQELCEFQQKKFSDSKEFGFHNVTTQDLTSQIERSCGAPLVVCGAGRRSGEGSLLTYANSPVGLDTLDSTFFRKSNTCNGYLFDYSNSTSID